MVLNLFFNCVTVKTGNYTVITNALIVMSVVYLPVLSREGSKKPQEHQGPKYMPHLSVADIRISFPLRKMLFSALEQLIRSFEQL